MALARFRLGRGSRGSKADSELVTPSVTLTRAAPDHEPAAAVAFVTAPVAPANAEPGQG